MESGRLIYSLGSSSGADLRYLGLFSSSGGALGAVVLPPRHTTPVSHQPRCLFTSFFLFVGMRVEELHGRPQLRRRRSSVPSISLHSPPKKWCVVVLPPSLPTPLGSSPAALSHLLLSATCTEEEDSDNQLDLFRSTSLQNRGTKSLIFCLLPRTEEQQGAIGGCILDAASYYRCFYRLFDGSGWPPIFCMS
jgi:hypothetical protein